jgi:DNA-binding NarL/FixJ family response regulator
VSAGGLKDDSGAAKRGQMWRGRRLNGRAQLSGEFVGDFRTESAAAGEEYSSIKRIDDLWTAVAAQELDGRLGDFPDKLRDRQVASQVADSQRRTAGAIQTTACQERDLGQLGADVDDQKRPRQVGTGHRDLVEACRAMMRGEPFLYAGAVTALVRTYLDRVRQGVDLPQQILTAREEEVLKLVAEGNSSKEIAEILTISIKTVERHRSNMLQKLGLRDRVDLTRYAIRTGLLEP